MDRTRGALLPLLAAAWLPAAMAAPTIAGCPLFPPDHVLNRRVDDLPVHARSSAWIANATRRGDGASVTLHMDFGAGLYPAPPHPQAAPIGIPYVVVKAGQPRVPMSFHWDDESDPGPYPIPRDAPIEGVGPADAGGDRHVLVVDASECKLYEVFNTWPRGGGWRAHAGAIFDLRSNRLRPLEWTSADAAGLSVVHGLARYEEVASGTIEHALRVTVPNTQQAYVWPARHQASKNTDPNAPPMGARLRLKSTVDIGRFTGQARTIAVALRQYGMVLADNGSAWFINGTPDPRWDNASLRQLKQLTGGDFEVVDTRGLMVSPDSAAARPRQP